MPSLSDYHSITVSLPSYKDAWVKVRTDATIDDILNIEKLEGTAAVVRLLARVILDWNFTDADGSKTSITEENVSKLHKEEMDRITEAIAADREKRKPTPQAETDEKKA